MRKYEKVILAFLLIKAFTYSDTGDIGLYSFEFNRTLKTETEKVYIKNNKKYIELQKMLDILGITNNQWINDEFTIDLENIYGQEKTINLREKYIKIGKIKTSFGDEIYEQNEKIYIQLDYLKNILSISDIDVDEDNLNIGIETSFRLPSELANIREYRREQFLAGDESSKKKIEEQKKFFEPGNIRLIYNYEKNFQAYNSEYKSLDAEYFGPALYGDLEVYYGIYPNLENYQTRLTYRDVYKDHDLIFGDTYVDMPDILSGTVGNIRGISFTKNYGLMSEYDSQDTILITGSAPMGKFVELYRNGQLLSYEDVKAGQYRFENVPLLFDSDSFYVVIYNIDGSIKKENLRRDGYQNLEKKGEFGYNIHMGESEYDRYYQFIGEVNYGLTNNTTLQTGYYDLKYRTFWLGDEIEDQESVKLGFIHVSDYTKYPYTLEASIYNNANGGQDYYYKYSQDYKDYKFMTEKGIYSDITEKRSGKKSETLYELDKRRFIFDNLTASLKYYITDYTHYGKEDEVGAVFRLGLRNLTPEYGIYRNLDTDYTQHDFSVRSYYFKDYILYAGVTHKTQRDFDETKYRVEVTSRRYRDNGIRYRAYYEKSQRYGDVFGIAFDIDYNDWFSGTADYRRDDGVSHLSTGFTLDKVIDLSDVNSTTTAVENGRINGIVYVDTNDNNIYDEGIDKPLPRTQVRVRGNTVYTNEKGEYRVNNLYPGSYETIFETQNPLYIAEADSYKVKIGPASTTKLDIPMKARKIVSGLIDFESDTLRHKYLKSLIITVTDVEKNKKVEVNIPENDGFFMLENLIKGKYKVVLESIEKPGVPLAETEVILDNEIEETEIELFVKEKIQ